MSDQTTDVQMNTQNPLADAPPASPHVCLCRPLAEAQPAPDSSHVSAVTRSISKVSHSFVHLAVSVSRAGPFMVLHQQW